MSGVMRLGEAVGSDHHSEMVPEFCQYGNRDNKKPDSSKASK